jgi:D-3-phosphoglycerate dehydrogenase / 2-oxoglutarate reductase
MRYKVVNTIHIEGMPFGEDLLKTIDAHIVNASGRSEEALIRAASDADAVICSGPVQPWSKQVIDSLAKCRIIASLGVGFDRIDLEAATKRSIVVTNIPDYCIDEVSSHTLALLMALGRKLLVVDRAVRKTHDHYVPFNRKGLQTYLSPIHRMRDQTVGVFGFGKIGTATALKAKGLGMTVIAHDPHVLNSIVESHGVTPVDFELFLKTSDYVCINASLNAETRGLFSEGIFKKMKPTAYLINTARGEIVDQPALIRALNNGDIAGAGLDVTEDDPIPENDPVLSLDNVILTGHSAWYSTTSDAETNFWRKAAEQVVLALEGKWPYYAVNTGVQKRWLEKWC